MSYKTLNKEWLTATAERIKRGEVTMEEARQKAEFINTEGKIFFKEIHRNTLREYFKKENIVVFEVGRKGFTHSTDHLFYNVVHVHINLSVGVTKTWMILNKRGIKCSHYEVEQVFRRNIYTPKPKPPKQKPRYRYVVDKVNAIWHGDIHYLIKNKSRRYIFALIDDRSRYIVGYGIFDLKTAMNCRDVFEEAISNVGRPPLIFWSDNGQENIGSDIKTFLKNNQIFQVRTIPGNPQSNGKIKNSGHHWKRESRILVVGNKFMMESENILMIITQVFHTWV